MTNRKRIAKTDICDYLTDMNDFIMHDSCGCYCVMLILRKQGAIICPDDVEDCHACISAWLNEEEPINE